MREDSLIASNMNVSYGGVVSTMHDTILKEIGPFTPSLSVGSTQKMNFVDTDDGPFWLDDDIRSSSKFDVMLDGQAVTIPSKNIKPGWCNKPKGMLQILFERGWIDRSLVKTFITM